MNFLQHLPSGSGSYPAANAWCATNEAHGSEPVSLYGFSGDEYDSADFELDILAADRATVPLQCPDLSDEAPWQFTETQTNGMPPPSALGEFDNASTSTNETKFDPNLQFSPPNSISPTIEDSLSWGNDAGHEISWDYVNNQLQPYIEPQSTTNGNHAAETQCSEMYNMQQLTPPSTAVCAPAGMLLRPYKTWFHIREMLEAKGIMYKNQPGVKFELFARVVHSHRQNLERKQLFQLRDLFKINLPCLPGVLLN